MIRHWTLCLCILVVSCGGGAGTDDRADSLAQEASTAATTMDEPHVPPAKLEGFPPAVARRLHEQDSLLAHRAVPAGDTATKTRVKSVIALARRWRPGDVLVIAFRGGTKALRDSVVKAAGPWTQAANITFDYWVDGGRRTYREWSEADQEYRAHVRIQFDTLGNWSYLGSEAIDGRYAPPGAPSMNFDNWGQYLPPGWSSTVLHEFGHALAFEHEHQNPLSACEAEFRWSDDAGYIPTPNAYGEFVPDVGGRRPGVYTYMRGAPNLWDSLTTTFNMRRFAFGLTREIRPFDSLSIMKYSFEPWIFRSGAASPCYTVAAAQLSAGDRAAATRHYPRQGRPGLNLDQLILQQVNSVIPATARSTTLQELKATEAGKASALAAVRRSANPR